MLIFWLVICTMYSLLILSFIIGFGRIKSFQEVDKTAANTFSIVIPFKNETQNLPGLLLSLSRLNYPKTKFEILLVDDASTDTYEQLIFDFITENPEIDLQILTNVRKSNSPKKDAISLAVQTAQYDWIVTTDADCKIPQLWLATLSEFINQQQPKMVVMPVTYTANNTFLERFQTLDFLSLIGSTIGSFGIQKPFLCNGANLAYSKEIFQQLSGFEGNDTIASGDDIFLMEKLQKHDAASLQYLKSEQVIVSTKPQPTWKTLLHQRRRWAAKTSAYQNPFSKLVAVIVLLMNIALPIFGILSFLTIIPFKFWLLGFAIKFNLDFFLLNKTVQFFQQDRVLRSYVSAFFLYPLFVAVVVIQSFFGTYNWKGHTFKK